MQIQADLEGEDQTLCLIMLAKEYRAEWLKHNEAKLGPISKLRNASKSLSVIKGPLSS